MEVMCLGELDLMPNENGLQEFFRRLLAVKGGCLTHGVSGNEKLLRGPVVHTRLSNPLFDYFPQDLFRRLHLGR